MGKHSVLLLYPDYVANRYGEETYLAWVEAEDARAAVIAGQTQAMLCQPKGNRPAAVDFFVLAVFEGHLSDLNPTMPRTTEED